MSTMSAIMVVLTIIFLGYGWYAINKKAEPPRRRRAVDDEGSRGRGPR
jgi:hypothetical protein